MMDIPDGYSLFREDLDFMLTTSVDDWAALRGCHLFLTGCTAFFGKWLLEAMLWADQQLHLDLRITVLSRHVGHFLDSMPHLKNYKSLYFMEGSILDFPVNVVEPFHYAIHAVNLPYTTTSRWAAAHILSALRGTERLWDIAIACNCRSTLLISSGAVYGIQLAQLQPLKEIGLPVSLSEPSVYGNTKRMLELYARALAEGSGMNVPIARCFAFIGAHMPLVRRSAIGSFFNDVLCGNPIIIQGDGTQKRSFLYGRDLVTWLIAAMVRGENETFNIGSSRQVSIKDLARQILRCAGKPDSDLFVEGRPTFGNAPNIYVPDVNKIISQLGVKESLLLEDSILYTLNWYYRKYSTTKKNYFK